MVFAALIALIFQLIAGRFSAKQLAGVPLAAFIGFLFRAHRYERKNWQSFRRDLLWAREIFAGGPPFSSSCASAVTQRQLGHLTPRSCRTRKSGPKEPGVENLVSDFKDDRRRDVFSDEWFRRVFISMRGA